MALGASSPRVQRQMMAQAVALVSYGVLIGIIGALALARLTASLPFGLEPTDPATFMVTIGVLLVVAVLASYVPALRASRVDPMSALRTN